MMDCNFRGSKMEMGSFLSMRERNCYHLCPVVKTSLTSDRSSLWTQTHFRILFKITAIITNNIIVSNARALIRLQTTAGFKLVNPNPAKIHARAVNSRSSHSTSISQTFLISCLWSLSSMKKLRNLN